MNEVFVEHKNEISFKNDLIYYQSKGMKIAYQWKGMYGTFCAVLKG